MVKGLGFWVRLVPEDSKERVLPLGCDKDNCLLLDYRYGCLEAAWLACGTKRKHFPDRQALTARGPEGLCLRPALPCDSSACDAQAAVPELPSQKREKYLALGLPLADVLILADDDATASYFEAVLAAGAAAKPAANWIMGDVMAHCKVGL
jgi:hypothetical protein